MPFVQRDGHGVDGEITTRKVCCDVAAAERGDVQTRALPCRIHGGKHADIVPLLVKVIERAADLVRELPAQLRDVLRVYHHVGVRSGDAEEHIADGAANNPRGNLALSEKNPGALQRVRPSSCREGRQATSSRSPAADDRVGGTPQSPDDVGIGGRTGGSVGAVFALIAFIFPHVLRLEILDIFHAVDVRDAVQVVGLMLQRLRQKTLGLDPESPARPGQAP